ncbi:MAG: hypothetical protein CMB80_17845 [Flammeovirgaceae bacterium]|nr:hypothetical protein [Flammeovirgaceae bacterium]
MIIDAEYLFRKVFFSDYIIIEVLVTIVPMIKQKEKAYSFTIQELYSFVIFFIIIYRDSAQYNVIFLKLNVRQLIKIFYYL